MREMKKTMTLFLRSFNEHQDSIIFEFSLKVSLTPQLRAFIYNDSFLKISDKSEKR